MTTFPILRPQEIPLDDPASCEMFVPSEAKPLVATPAAIEMYGQEMILACLQVLQESAVKQLGHDGKPFTLWNLVDVLTHLNVKLRYAGDRVEADQKVAKLMQLAV